jgi:hypothetical protein
MAYQLTFDDPGRDTNTFYRRTLHVLSDARVPFLVGGSHAILHYTGIIRETKDFDLFVRRADVEKALESLAVAGYWTQITFPHWLAKAKQGSDHVDLVFSSGNGLCRVDDGWFDHAVEAEVLGMPVKIAPVEELLWQKSFVMERERYDGDGSERGRPSKFTESESNIAHGICELDFGFIPRAMLRRDRRVSPAARATGTQ